MFSPGKQSAHCGKSKPHGVARWGTRPTASLQVSVDGQSEAWTTFQWQPKHIVAFDRCNKNEPWPKADSRKTNVPAILGHWFWDGFATHWRTKIATILYMHFTVQGRNQRHVLRPRSPQSPLGFYTLIKNFPVSHGLKCCLEISPCGGFEKILEISTALALKWLSVRGIMGRNWHNTIILFQKNIYLAKEDLLNVMAVLRLRLKISWVISGNDITF